MKRKQLLMTGAIATVLTGVGGASLASAATVSSGDETSSLVDKIAQKFNLKKDDVQKVFDEQKSERNAERQKNFSERLQKKVDSGNITAEQKTLIENKFKELKEKHESMRKELETWADENKIDLKYLHKLGHHRGNDRLQDAVDDGDITAAQKTLIDNKLNELKDQRETEKEALKQWADENDIDLKDIMPMGGGRGHGRGGFGRH